MPHQHVIARGASRGKIMVFTKFQSLMRKKNAANNGTSHTPDNTGANDQRIKCLMVITRPLRARAGSREPPCRSLLAGDQSAWSDLTQRSCPKGRAQGCARRMATELCSCSPASRLLRGWVVTLDVGQLLSHSEPSPAQGNHPAGACLHAIKTSLPDAPSGR